MPFSSLARFQTRTATGIRPDLNGVADPHAVSPIRFTLRPELSARLRELTNNGPFLIFTILCSALAVRLSRQNNSDTVMLRSPALRTSPDGVPESVLISIRVDENLSMREHLESVRQSLLDAFANPLGNDSAAGHPVLLALEDLHRPVTSSAADLMLRFHCDEPDLKAVLEYRSGLYRQSTMECLWEQLETILANGLGDTSASLKQISMQSEAERTRVLTAWNARQNAYPLDRTVVSLFKEQVARTPGATAVSIGSQSLSYCQLEQRADRIAQQLTARGCGAESVVGVLLENSLDLVAALLGVLTAGAAYMPLDPAHPPQRVAMMLTEFPPQLLITSPDRVADAPGVAALVLPSQDREGESQLTAAPVAGSSDLAYVIYTSGSTGKPKCAGVVHRGWTNLLSWYIEEFEITANDRTLLLTSLGFDLTQKNILAPLLTGGLLRLVPAGVFDPRAICDEVRDQQITILNCTPSMFYALLEDSGPDFAEKLSSLRLVVLGGEPIQMARLSPWIATGTRAEIANTYGPTECTDICCVYRITDPGMWRGASIPIGRPIPNVQVYLLDAAGQPVAVGTQGELCIAGVGVGRGYLNDAELTAARFTPNPFGDGMLYRTGDSARYMPNGEIEFVGRVDHQVKVRGVRLELGEVEAQLAAHAAVQECAVIVCEDSSGANRLEAFVVPGSSASTVRRQLELDPSEARALSELPNGLSVFHLNRSETEFVYREIFEQESYFQHGIELPEDAVVIDVGANIGLFALAVAMRQPTAKLICYEPVPPVFSLLKRNVELHGLNAQCRNVGLSCLPGRRKLTYYPNVSIMSGYYAAGDEDRANIRVFLTNRDQDSVTSGEIDDLLDGRLKHAELSCDFRTLSGELRELGLDHVDLLKIDVEKSELDVLEGLDTADWARIHQVVMEVHDIDGRLGRILDLLARNGFGVKVEQDRLLTNSHIYNLYGKRPGTSRASSPATTKALWRSRRELLSSLHDFLSGTLPDALVPSAFHLLPRLPLGPSGKVDRRALREMAFVPQESLEPFVAPSTPVELRLAGIWQELLDTPAVGANHNFFRLGGHSLLATRMISQVRRAFQVEISINSFFEAPTIAATAAAVEAAMMDEIECLTDDEAARMVEE